MEWVEITGKTVDEARDHALDRLGVAEEEAEIEVLEEPRTGLFGRVRGEARVRARIRPTAARSKQERRGRGRPKGKDRDLSAPQSTADSSTVAPESGQESAPSPRRAGADTRRNGGAGERRDERQRPKQRKERAPMNASDEGLSDRPEGDERDGQEADPAAVGQAAVEFMTGLAAAFGSNATATLNIEGNELDVRIQGDELGLLIGPGGRTLLAVQDLARVASQRRLGDHETRLRIDVAGYRERRRAALEQFAAAVANEVLTSGRGKALEPMPSADRKIVHDAIQAIEGVTSHSDGEEPRRRVVITPA
jgi:spoIIIJ-associated protein